MPAIIIIPARYASTRFPGKPLCPLSGKPLIRHVYERSKQAKSALEVFVATDNKLIYDAVEGFGGKAIMTSENHPSGTDRIAEAVKKLENTEYGTRDTDIIVNVQGDEPMIQPEMIDDVIKLMEDERASIGTLAKKIEEAEEITDPNIVKVVFDEEGFALYFSRSPIPYHRDGNRLSQRYFKHIGIYAYRKDVLLRLSALPSTRLEDIEKLEQLRALENGFKIKVKETGFETIGVDTLTDLERVEKCLSISL
ncbi:MAG TPA: 3-deoxy-manno-octulosonate cytidylyltransferase [Nitrospiraceae bacterium]|nr:MAG: 3-deoxy-manno-octulosonate cytidylyltransferase [Nitrospirae bacterium GWA2_46_11]OGW23827.1 MAG: 3-deoxy-manno-octulosonate cytidylyltransferase [Nitrospirae bacterium GWB2_47_37]HAK88491.1 3-deoxy-manno-octulosonate cytidylyltransferase [Nitrospiraceae bacterium]HCZ11366.1 3-deoxy-manno-octulosonate cytidylyltransferase [Nitrospiraceae bacterium]